MNLFKFFLNKEKLFRDIPQLINPVKHIKKQAESLYISAFAAINIFSLLFNQKQEGII